MSGLNINATRDRRAHVAEQIDPLPMISGSMNENPVILPPDVRGSNETLADWIAHNCEHDWNSAGSGCRANMTGMELRQ